MRLHLTCCPASTSGSSVQWTAASAASAASPPARPRLSRPPMMQRQTQYAHRKLTGEGHTPFLLTIVHKNFERSTMSEGRGQRGGGEADVDSRRSQPAAEQETHGECGRPGKPRKARLPGPLDQERFRRLERPSSSKRQVPRTAHSWRGSRTPVLLLHDGRRARSVPLPVIGWVLQQHDEGACSGRDGARSFPALRRRVEAVGIPERHRRRGLHTLREHTERARLQEAM